MIENIHKEYPLMDEESRSFTRRLLFLDLIETVHDNRKWNRGPQKIKQIMRNDIAEFLRHQNYEACWLYSDTLNHFKKDIEDFDS